MNVAYNSRTRKPEIEGAEVSYESKTELLRSCDVISVHVPKGTTVLSAEDFVAMRSGTILVQTSCGIVCDTAALGRWLKDEANFVIMDESVDESYRVFQNAHNVLFPPVVAGRTEESRRRLSDQVLGNLEAFLNGTPRNVIN
jgi:phosphoglycerate dehydrogenase-like enzyme